MNFSANFKEWFRDSKVVDRQGKPLIVYHGSDAPRKKFDPSKCQLGCHFGTKAQAEDFASDGGVLMACYLSIQNPIRLADEPSWSERGILEQALPPRVYYWAQNTSDVKGDDAFRHKWMRKVLMNADYDGVVYLNRTEGLSSADRAKSDRSDVFHWQDDVSDAEFKKEFPSARDSWIIFKSDQVKVIGRDEVDLESVLEMVWGVEG